LLPIPSWHEPWQNCWQANRGSLLKLIILRKGGI
jgi:hypothetical protein